MSRNFCKNILDNISHGVYVIDNKAKIRYWNRSMEKITGIRSQTVTGHPCTNKKFFYFDRSGDHSCNQKQCILLNSIKYGCADEKEFYLHHKDGYQVPIYLRAAPLKNAHNQIIGAVGLSCVNIYKMAGIKYATEQELLAYIDPLTGVGNRRYLEMNIQRRLDELSRYSWKFGIFFIDIDHFKKVNDKYGHDTGDELLKIIAGVLKRNLRPYDSLGRWGGEEFIATVMGINQDSISTLANRLRRAVEEHKFMVRIYNIKFTISIGAIIGKTTDTVDGVIKKADKLMYQSKKAGRNCISIDTGTRLVAQAGGK
ncbi:MAG: sensor domain-containing diguanylate cyclase [Planctomycetes bacterium]|nr:sensor domain-containing diguanylate cyclase [Planctomycetota bacterium]